MFNQVTVTNKKTEKDYILSKGEIQGKELATLSLDEFREIANTYDDTARGSDVLEREDYLFEFKETSMGEVWVSYKQTGDQRFALELSPADRNDEEETLYIYEQ